MATRTKITKDGAYIEAVGRRKTAVARARIEKKSKGEISVNGKSLNDYFKLPHLQNIVCSPLNENELTGTFAISLKVYGGGFNAQAEASRHAISRALVKSAETMRAPLKKAGYLTRNPKMKERRKFGLKKARKAAQWSKR